MANRRPLYNNGGTIQEMVSPDTVDPSLVAGGGDIALTMMASNSDETITAGYSAIVTDWYEISAGNTLDIGALGVLELT